MARGTQLGGFGCQSQGNVVTEMDLMHLSISRYSALEIQEYV